MDAKSKLMVVGGTSLISFGFGCLAGYLFTRNQLAIAYDEIAQAEIAKAKQFYSAMNKRGRFATPKSTLRDRLQKEDPKEKAIRESRETIEEIKASRASKIYRGEEPPPPGFTERTNYENHVKQTAIDAERFKREEKGENPEEIEPKYVISDSGFDYEEEIKTRTPDAPYVISREEFFEEETDNDQLTVTFFQGDHVVIDQQEIVIDDVDAVLGDDNLTRFGQRNSGSGDPNVMYIRNEKLTADFEVILDHEIYEEKILGLSHSNRRPSRKRDKKTKFKRGDDA